MTTSTIMTDMSALRQPSRSRRLLWLAVIGVVTASSLAALWLKARMAERASSSPRGHWVQAEQRTLSTTVSATGTVKPKTGAEVRVGAQLSGIVRRLNVTVGSKIHRGDVIAEIDSRAILAKIDQADSQVAQAQVAVAKAGSDFTRSKKLYEAGLIAAQQNEDAAAALAAANASLAAAETARSSARVDLDYTEIRAPISGTVASVGTQQGETVAASFATPTFITIIQDSALEVIAMVDEADIGSVRRGESITFTTETYPDHEFTGRVERIAPVATILSGVVNYEVAISIAQDIGMLRPDMTTNVNISTSAHEALLVPAAAVHKESGESFVKLQTTSGRSVRQRVTPGARVGNDLELTRGVKPGERVFIEEGNAQP
ncbi:MAG TPA: efflux RND transporter periplasmic adaptor subunit [Acidisarcina sp.]